MLKTEIILKDDGYDDGEKLNEWWWLNGRDDGNYETTIMYDRWAGEELILHIKFKDLIVTSQMNNKKYKSTVWLVWFLLYKFKFKSVKV